MIVPLEKIEYGFEHSIIRSSYYIIYSIFYLLKGEYRVHQNHLGSIIEGTWRKGCR